MHINFKTRTPAEQEELNGYMRRKEVLEYTLFKALNVDPATPAEVEAFLEFAPPEVHVLLEGLLGKTGHGIQTADSTELDHHQAALITAGLVGFLSQKRQP